MTDPIIIRTANEANELIPDKWVLGAGLSTNDYYILHTAAPLMIVQCPTAPLQSEIDQLPCIVYLNGNVNPDAFNRLFAEAWKLLEIYKDRMDPPSDRDEKEVW